MAEMALTYYAGWDFARIGTGSLNFTDSSGTFSITDFTSGTYANTTMETITGTGNYSYFATALASALDAASSIVGSYVVTYNDTSGFYTIDPPGASTFTINTASTVMRNILGIATSGSVGPSATVTSSRRTYYTIIPAITARSNVTDDYEPDDICADGETDDGSAYGISRATSPLYHDWVQAMEAKSACFKNSATASVPWTYQHMFEHCRNVEPIYVKDSEAGVGTDDMVIKLRADGARWAPDRVTADYDDLWSIPFRTRVVTTSAGVSRL
jgi:hypothetical protein